MQNEVLAMLRGDVQEICIATTFVVLGLLSVSIAALRRRAGVRVFLWLGVWSAAYGVMHLLGARAVVLTLPGWMQVAAPYVFTTVSYTLVVCASLAWLDLITGAMRRMVIALVIASSATAVLGIGWFVATGVSNRFMLLNNLLAAAILVILLVTITNERLYKKYLLLPNRGVLVAGTLIFSAEALFTNLTRPFFDVRVPVLFDHLGFLALLIGFGYSGLKLVLTNEHRLTEMQAEMEVARQIQLSILPTEVPKICGVQVSALYKPVASVAGDFYEFLPVDEHRAGFLVADVCGHGVPAALIASMLKVAVRSVAEWADRPAEFLATLNRVLAEPLKGQLVSAAYLWVDMRAGKALYSAAGHPPLLRWNHGLERIASNGLLFGVDAGAEYPQVEVPLGTGDRLLLYTDGITEPENGAGEMFGDIRLEQLLTKSAAVEPHQLSERIVDAIGEWQPEQQDDMTLVVIGVNQ